MKNILIVCFIAVVLVVGGAYFYFKKPIPSTTSTVDTAGWKTYSDPAGFSLKYPPDVVINSGSKDTTHRNLSVSSELVSEIQDQPIVGGMAEAIKDKEALAKGEIAGAGFASDAQIVKIGSLNGKVATTLSQFEVCSVVFARSLTFYPNNYRVMIGSSGNKDQIISEMPEFFKLDKANCGDQKMWSNTEGFLQALKTHQGGAAAQSWYDTFDEIIKTITIKP